MFAPHVQTSIFRYTSTFLLGYSVLFTPVGFMTAIVKDCQTGYKRQLVIMGLKNRFVHAGETYKNFNLHWYCSAYWLASFLTDWSLSMFVAVNLFIAVAAFKIGFAGAAFAAFVAIVLTNQVWIRTIC
jgi:hypothetical protein